jgi:hypothetical protein
MYQSVSLIPSLKMAYVVFPSINSAKSIYQVRILKKIYGRLVSKWKPEFEWERQDIGVILTQHTQRRGAKRGDSG